MTEIHEHPPIGTHVTSVSDDVLNRIFGRIPGLRRPAQRNRVMASQTVVMNTANPFQQILNENPNRLEAWIIPSGDGEFLICRSETNASKNSTEANNANGSVNGAFVPKPSANNASPPPVPCHTTDPVWVSATTGVLALASVRVGVIEILDQ